MSKCSKKCNELKKLIDNISGLNDAYVFEELCSLENRLELLAEYGNLNEVNGTSFKRIDNVKLAEMQDALHILEDTDISNIDDAENIDLRTYQYAVNTLLEMYYDEKKLARKLIADDLNHIMYKIDGGSDLIQLMKDVPPIIVNRISTVLSSEYISYDDLEDFIGAKKSNIKAFKNLRAELEDYLCDKALL